MLKNNTSYLPKYVSENIKQRGYCRPQKKGLTPSNILEFFFYLHIFYSIFGVRLGIDIPFFGAVWLGVLSMWSIFLWRGRIVAREGIGLVFAVVFLYVLVQNLVFKIPISDPFVRPFINWVTTALVMAVLVTNNGFLKRLSVVMFIVSLLLLPSMVFMESSSGLLRARLDAGSGIDNPNDFAAWIGFSCLIFWLWGSTQNNSGKKLTLVGMTAVGFVVMIQTVSRGALIALFMSIVTSLIRMQLRQKALLLAVLTMIFLIGFNIPLITQGWSYYSARGSEDTGRFLIWPIAVKTIVQQPFLGYGADNIELFSLERMRSYSPHNGIITLWLTSGFLPVIPFTIMWLRAIMRSRKRTVISYYRELDNFPIIIYAFLEMLISNYYFITIWSVAAIFSCLMENNDKP